eukprot:940378-Rhodomonas_salina.1
MKARPGADEALAWRRVGELGMTVLAFGPTLFLADSGNLFDLFLLLATLATIMFAASFRGASQ